MELLSPPPVTPADVPGLLAGAAEVDLTPPPGLPKAGYSRNARDGDGFRTRLRARVVHLRCGRSSLAIVATDLLGGSAIVHHQVAAAVARSTDVPLAGLFLGATHTHGAPGQFHGSDFYNRFSANRPGFDPRWTAFLVERITSAVEQAVRARRPALAAWGRAPVHGLTRNRSLPAFARNPESGGPTADPVNPWLDLLRVDGADGEPLAALVTFSVHGTAVPMSTGPYNADLWSYLCTRLGDRITGPDGRRPVVGALQGTHGDVTPALERPAGHAEAARIGRGVAEVAATVHASLDGALRPRLDLAAALREIDLREPAQRLLDGVRLPARPAVGAALVAGARENLTPVISALPVFRAGHGKRWHRSPHGAKWVLGSRWGQPLTLPLDGFPRVLPVQLLRVGEVLLAGLPMEITTVSGRRFAAAVERAWATPGARAVISSVADEYAGYCTTEAEYGAQFYEGGHTLYGPATQEFLAAALARLTTALRAAPAGLVQDAVPRRTLRLAVRERMPAPTGRSLPVTSLGPVHSRRPGEYDWAFAGPAPGDLDWGRTVVAVEADDGRGWAPVPQPGGRVLDDGHGDLEVTLTGGRVYRARWHAAELGSVPAVRLPGREQAPRYRFRSRDACSPPF